MLLATDPWLSDVADWIKAFHSFFWKLFFLCADICIHKTRILSIYAATCVDRSSVVWLYILNKIDMKLITNKYQGLSILSIHTKYI